MSEARFAAAVALGVALVSAGVLFEHRRHRAAPAPSGAPARHAANKVERESLAISFALDESPRGTVARFLVTDSATGKPVSGLRPLAWMSARKPEGARPDEKRCKETIKEHLSGMLSAQAEVDMNSYLLWTLNGDGTLSVINPQIALSKTKTRAIVSLPARGDDLAFRADKRFAYVSLPAVDQVAVVDAVHFRVDHSVGVGRRPGRIVASPEGASVWVGDDAGGTVSVLSTDDGSLARTLPAGAGAHDFAFVGEGRWVWATSEEDDVIHVYDARRRELAAQIPAARGAVAIAASDRAGAVYVATRSGELLVFDAESRRRSASMRLAPELGTVRVDPSGRWVVALSRRSGNAWVIDASTSQVRRSIDGLASPDAVSFTDAFAYVRNADAERVTLIDLTSVDRVGSAAVVEIVAGQKPPAGASGVARASAIVATPDRGSVIIAQPADRALYVYREGMMAPLGTLADFGREPIAAAIQDRSLEETAPGVYATVVSLESDGLYDVAMLLEAPRVAICFEETVRGHGPARRSGPSFELRPGFDPRARLRVGQPAHLAFRVVDRRTDEPIASEGVDVLFFRMPSQWRGTARRGADGAYHVDVTPRQEGRYTLAVGTRTPGLGTLEPIAVDVDPAGAP